MEKTSSQGLALAAGANIWWGLSPLFWRELSHVESLTTVSQRIAWSALLIVFLHTFGKSWSRVIEVARQPRNLAVAAGASVLLFLNWIVFIWAVGQNRVTESALGYFLMPLVSVLLGAVFFSEQLRPVQWLCVAIVGSGVVWLTLDVGQLPWVALTLGITFGLYGALRKFASYGALDGLTLEVGLLVLPFVGYLTWLQFGDTPSITAGTPRTTLLFMASAVVTTLPLVTFARAVRLIPLSIAGLLQYLNPTIQFLVGVLIFAEAFQGGQVIGYAVIWVGLAIFAIESFITGRSAATRASLAAQSKVAAQTGSATT